MFSRLREQGTWLVAYSQPNANLSEHALAYSALGPVYRPDIVVLPVFLDDIREQGIRDFMMGFADDPQTRARLQASPVGQYVLPYLTEAADASGRTTDLEQDTTTQSRVEESINGWLDRQWPLWAERSEIRGTMGAATHLLRNRALGIHSNTKRPVAAGTYEQRIALLDALLGEMRGDGAQVLLYLPPYRQDISGPYVESDYERLKADLQELAEKHGATYADYETVVPGPLWATVRDKLFGFPEPDFMHFTAEGHRLLVDEVERTLQQMAD